METTITPVRRNGTKPKPKAAVPKLAKARAKKTLAQTVAETAAPAPTHKPKVKNIMLPVEVIAQVDRRVADYLEKTGNALSWSALGEVAFLELIGRDDFDDLVAGTRARRPA